MKAHKTDRWVDLDHPEYLNSKERRVAKKYIDSTLQRVLPALVARAMLVVFKAMKDSGYKANSINNVINHIENAMQYFEHYQMDGIGDDALFFELQNYGVNVSLVEPEEQNGSEKGI